MASDSYRRLTGALNFTAAALNAPLAPAFAMIHHPKEATLCGLVGLYNIYAGVKQFLPDLRKPAPEAAADSKVPTLTASL